MRLSPIYEQKLAEAKQEGIQAERRNVIENLSHYSKNSYFFS
ncbi:MAG: hypothetical protein ACYTX0_43925 [Nostoc sp.]